jgi:hypothetical protein
VFADTPMVFAVIINFYKCLQAYMMFVFSQKKNENEIAMYEEPSTWLMFIT